MTTPRSDALAEDLTDRLAAFSQLLMQRGRGDAFNTMAAHDLSVTQVRILHVLLWGDHDPAQVEIAEQIALSEAAAGRAIDALVRAGLAERRADTDDRRIRRVTLTESGRAIVEGLAEARRADLHRFVDDLSPDERRRLDDALSPILAVRAAVAQPGPGCG